MDGQKTFIFGDVHGCVEALRQLVGRIPLDPGRDRLIFLGDYIDRGRDPKGVVDFILELTRSSHEIGCLAGNHEFMFMDFLAGRNRRLFFVNGGQETLRSYQGKASRWDDECVPPEHRAFFGSLETYLVLPDYYVVHAGFRPGVAVNRQELEDIIWIREPFIESDHDFGKPVIFGHTPFRKPYMNHRKIGIDTGAVYGGNLTCLELPALKFHSVPGH